MYKFVVAISGLTFVLECWKFIWQVELDKRNKSKKRRLLELDDGLS